MKILGTTLTGTVLSIFSACAIASHLHASMIDYGVYKTVARITGDDNHPSMTKIDSTALGLGNTSASASVSDNYGSVSSSWSISRLTANEAQVNIDTSYRVSGTSYAYSYAGQDGEVHFNYHSDTAFTVNCFWDLTYDIDHPTRWYNLNWFSQMVKLRIYDTDDNWWDPIWLPPSGRREYPFYGHYVGSTPINVGAGDWLFIVFTGGSASRSGGEWESMSGNVYLDFDGGNIDQPNYTVTTSANVDEVHVPGATTIGDGAQPMTLTARHLRTGTLHILNQATLVISPNGADSGVSRAGSLKLEPSATFDLTDNDLVVDASAQTRDTVLADVTSSIVQARSNPAGRWLGPGLTSSAAASNPDTTLIPMLNDKGDGTPLFTTFGGLDVDTNSVLVKYSWNGDVNLDGRINADDYFRIDTGFLAQPANPTYRDGDFNFDHKINADDYFLIDQAFLNQKMGFASPLDAVPEPSTLLLFGLAGCILASRQR